MTNETTDTNDQQNTINEDDPVHYGLAKVIGSFIALTQKHPATNKAEAREAIEKMDEVSDFMGDVQAPFAVHLAWDALRDGYEDMWFAEDRVIINGQTAYLK